MSATTRDEDLRLALDMLRSLEEAMTRGLIGGRRADAIFEQLLRRLPGISSVAFQPWTDGCLARDPTGRSTSRLFPVTCGGHCYGTLAVDIGEGLGVRLREVIVGAAAAALGAFLQMATLREENTILGAMLGSRVHEPSPGVRHSPGDNDAPVSRQPMELGRIIDAALAIARAAFGACGQRFTATVPDVGVSIEVDGGRITHVVASLLATAALCGPRGADVHVDAAQQGDWAVLSVQHGLESHRELLPHAFDGLGSVFDDEDAIGSGARRPSVRSIVEQHGGSISVETHPGTSSRFMLRLPLARTLDRGRRRGPLMQGDAKVIRLDTVRDEGGVEGRRRLVVRSKFRSSRG